MVAPGALADQSFSPAAPVGSHPESFIPLRQGDLAQALCLAGAIAPSEGDHFLRLSRLVAAHHRAEYDATLERLERAYAPFDPDRDCLRLGNASAREREEMLNELLRELSWLMARANFRHLSRSDIEPALASTSHWGLDMDVDFRVFDRLTIFTRGDTCQRRRRRRRWLPWRGQEIDVPVYRRVVMALKLRAHSRLGSQVDQGKVYLQLFKDIPKLDLKMLLPGARVRISRTDRGKVGLSLLTGLGLTLWKVVGGLAGSLAGILFFDNPVAAWGLATGTLGYGVKSYYGYQQTRQRYTLSLTQLLYFQNLDTNAGVLYRVLNEAREQEGCEATLAYYVLWQHAGRLGMTCRQVRERAEAELARATGMEVSFGAAEALENLRRLGLATCIGDHFQAQPPAEAADALAGIAAGQDLGQPPAAAG